MKTGTVLLLLALLFSRPANTFGQNVSFNGEASAWSLYADRTSATRFGIRYIPDLKLDRKFADSLYAVMDVSLNAYATTWLQTGQNARSDNAVKLYRASLQLSSDALEARVGRQQIEFGSATLFRPLMWFDRTDPRDPLHITDGVYALLLRYRFNQSANIMVWGLTGNDSTGWETAPTAKKSIEFGGRVQTLAGPGETGFSFHHREADTGVVHGFPLSVQGLTVPENRFGVDGKWDLGIGAWFEAVLIHGQSLLPGKCYQRQYTAGFDFTIATGNGLHILAEYYRSEAAAAAFGPSTAYHLAGLSFKYPIDSTDIVSGILYRDLTHNDTYRFLTWQTSYKNWSFFAMAFINPDTLLLAGPQSGNIAFAGSGGQIMIVFKH